MGEYCLPDKLRAVRETLTYAELRMLSQEVLDQVTPVVYNNGLFDGEERLLARKRDERERRKVGRAKHWRTAVYFIKSPHAIKIGMSKDPERRLGVIQTSHPYKLELMAICDGGSALEAEYHARFAAHRLHGEWFAPHPDIYAEIDRLKTLDE